MSATALTALATAATPGMRAKLMLAAARAARPAKMAVPMGRQGTAVTPRPRAPAMRATITP